MKEFQKLRLDDSRSPLDRLLLYQNLIFFEGPILSHYVSFDFEDDWLYLWVDTDDELNRWLLFGIENKTFELYMKQKVTLRNLLSEPKNNTIYVYDSEKRENQLRNLFITTPDSLPSDYLPASDSYYEFEPIDVYDLDLDEAELYGLVELDGEWSLNNFADFASTFHKLYAFTTVLTRGEIFPLIYAYPWRGGYSSIGFFNRILARVQAPLVSSIKYSSPGHLSLDVEKDSAKVLEQSLLGYIKNKDSVETIYKELEDYIRVNKFNTVSVSSEKQLELTSEQSEVLSDYLRKLTENINIYDSITENLRTDSLVFRLAKAFMAYIRTLRDLNEFHSEGLAQIYSVKRLVERDNHNAQSAPEISFISRTLSDEDLPF